MTPPAVAVDAGQTEIRAVLVDGHGPVVATAGGGQAVDGHGPVVTAAGGGQAGAAGAATLGALESLSIAYLGRVATAAGVERIDGAAVDGEAVAAALLAAVGRLDLPVAAGATVAIGLSGFEAAWTEELERIEALVRSELDAGQVVIASDGVTSLLGALGERPGAVVAAGTGTIVVARGRAGWARVDGWGSLLGDAGSGFAIGRAGLDAALRELDGRGGSARLLDAARRCFAPALDGGAAAGAPPRAAVHDAASALPGEADDRARATPAVQDLGAALVAAVHRAPVPARAVAGFAEVVGRLAGEGEATSVRILAAAGRELALSACAALDRTLADDEPAMVSYAGNVFKAGQPLIEPLAEALAELRPGTRLVAPAADSLAGAAALARDPDALPGHPGLLWRAA